MAPPGRPDRGPARVGPRRSRRATTAGRAAATCSPRTIRIAGGAADTRAARPGRRGARRCARRSGARRSGDSSRCSRPGGRRCAAVAEVADQLRRDLVGDVVTFVRNRNINYTNICTFKCRFCAFSKGPLSLNLRGEPYLLEIDEIQRRVVEAVECGATEVCLQGGIHPDFDGDYYLDVIRAVKEVAPSIHVHGFTALEVTEGARRLGMDLAEYLTLAKEAGLATLPGTAAEILDDEVRAVICPDKITTEEWLHAHRTAHAVGLRSNVTIMFGSVERPEHVARHLLRTRALQRETGGFTEFVPLPFVHMATPIYLTGRARRGPTFREVLLMHAVGRIAYAGAIDNIQISWVKTGVDGAQQALPGRAATTSAARSWTRTSPGRPGRATARRPTTASSPRSSTRSGGPSSSAPRSTAAPRTAGGGCGHRPRRSTTPVRRRRPRRLRTREHVGRVSGGHHVTAIDVVAIGNALVDVLSTRTTRSSPPTAWRRGRWTSSTPSGAETSTPRWARASRSPGAARPTRSSASRRSGGTAAYIGRVRDDQLGAVYTHDLRAAGVRFDDDARHRRPAHRAGPDPRDPRRGAHDEHLPRRLVRVRRRGRRSRPDPRARRTRTSRATSGTRPTRRRRTGSRPRSRTRRAARWRSRCPTASCVDRHRADLPRSHRGLGRRPVRERRRDRRGCTRSTTSTRRSSGSAITARSRRVTRGAAGSVLLAGDDVIEVPAEPVPAAGWSTPPVPATSTPPACCTGSCRGRDLHTCGRLGGLAAAGGHLAPRRPAAGVARDARRRRRPRRASSRGAAPLPHRRPRARRRDRARWSTTVEPGAQLGPGVRDDRDGAALRPRRRRTAAT